MRSHVDSEAQVFLTAFGLYSVADHPVASCCFAKVLVSLPLDDICNSEDKNLVSINFLRKGFCLYPPCLF